MSVGVQSAGFRRLERARSTCATTGAELPTRRASMVSGEPDGRRTLPGVTSSATRDGNSRSDSASAAWRIVPRPANAMTATSSQRCRRLESGAAQRVRRNDRVGVDRAPRAAPTSSVNRRPTVVGGSGDAANSAALTSRSSSDCSRSSTKRATRPSDGTRAAGQNAHTIAATAASAAGHDHDREHERRPRRPRGREQRHRRARRPTARAGASRRTAAAPAAATAHARARSVAGRDRNQTVTIRSVVP